MATALKQTAISEEEIAETLGKIVSGYRHQARSPILATPASVDLAFEDVTFPSEDGVPLEAWFIPCEGSTKLIVANHPRFFNRYGLPSHLEPFKSLFGSSGNDFEVNFIPDYKILHDAGYNVLTYDLRNFGHSGSGNDGMGSGGRFESRDVIGSLNYVRSRGDLSGMTLGLFSRCLGCNATMFAMARHPKRFADVRCMIGVQPLSVRMIMSRMLALAGIPAERIEDLDRDIKMAISFDLDDMSPVDAARSVTMPTFLYGVHDDLLTRPSDVQTIFDNMPAADKELFWIEGSTHRWDGYTFFQREPKQMLEWFGSHMA